MAESIRHIRHLLLRATSSDHPQRLKDFESLSIAQAVDLLLKESEFNEQLEYLSPPSLNDKGEVSNFNILKALLNSQHQMEELNYMWLHRLSFSQALLRERMTFFWHNHFATSIPFAYLMQMQNNVIRQHALGSFKEMLMAMAMNPAMIIYLNNQQNKKNSPNENFAREVMELFTLGIGHYSENDIKEAARAFTGYSVNKGGQTEFKESEHDYDLKKVRGKEGKFDAPDIIHLLLEDEQTALHITKKIYKEFVNDNINEDVVKALAKSFFDSGYNIASLMKNIFTSTWFYEEKNIGSRIASPVELIIRLKNLVAFDVEDYRTQIEIQKVLGQVLFFPPNVAGWKGGHQWINSSSLLTRMNLPLALAGQSALKLKGKQAFEDASDIPRKLLELRSDWKPLIQRYSSLNKNEAAEKMFDDFIIAPQNKMAKQKMIELADHSTPQKFIVSMAASIMAQPEFQLI